MKPIVVDLRVVRALRAVQAQPERHWQVRDLAKLAGASRASLARLFQAETGTSPQRYLRAVRLAEAARLLATGGETLARIASRVGYQSEFALSRAFKRHYGVAPSRYRRQSSVTLRCVA